MLLYYRQVVETGKHGAAEVDPVNGPRIFFIAAISMFGVLRKDEKFIRSHLEFFLSDLVPAIPVRAIKKEIFRQSFFTISVVAFGIGIITRAADVQGF